MLFAFVEIKKIQMSARDHFQRIFNDHEKLKLQLESQKKELEVRGTELEKREAKNESESKRLAEEVEQVLCFVLHGLLGFHIIQVLRRLNVFSKYMHMYIYTCICMYIYKFMYMNLLAGFSSVNN